MREGAHSVLRGLGASEGVGIGRVVTLKTVQAAPARRKPGTPEQELARLQEAARRCEEETKELAMGLRAAAGHHESEILTGQAAMLTDPALRGEMERAVKAGASAEESVERACGKYAALFETMEEEMMRQRAADVRDMERRLIGLLTGQPRQSLTDLPMGTVLVVEELTPSMTAELRRERVEAVVTKRGGMTSHSAILARALELPAVLGVTELPQDMEDGWLAAVDGGRGEVVLQPEEGVLAQYRERRQRWKQERALADEYRAKATRDGDGKRYLICGNISRAAEAKDALLAGAEGVGLFRTEYLFMERTTPPGEEEQMESYLQAARAMEGREVVVRTVDIGGDKPVGCVPLQREENPFLGLRGIRLCLKRPELLRTQLRALLRAGAEAPQLAVLVPMVSTVEEVRRVRQMMEEAKERLTAEGRPAAGAMRLGVMIETPAAAVTADLLARECDFFSVGTNDLTGYMMAADRGNPAVSGLYDPMHPAVLRTLRRIGCAARTAGIPAGVCGEAAADPALLPLLMAWGYSKFSVNGAAIPRLRRSAANWKGREARKLAEKCLGLETGQQVCRLLRQAQR